MHNGVTIFLALVVGPITFGKCLLVLLPDFNGLVSAAGWFVGNFTLSSF